MRAYRQTYKIVRIVVLTELNAPSSGLRAYRGLPRADNRESSAAHHLSSVVLSDETTHARNGINSLRACQLDDCLS